MLPPLLLANLFSTWGLAAALAALCFVALRANWFRQRRSEQATVDPDSIRQACAPKPRETALQNAPDEMLRWQVEMHETAREFKGEIDAKLLALQSLLIVAGEHCQRLEALLQRAEKLDRFSSSRIISGREILARIENATGELPPLDAQAQGKEILTAAQAKLAKQLATEEYDPAEIARYLGASIVDVELFLSMHSE